MELLCGTKKNELKYRYVIPPQACSKHFNHELPFSGLVALFDEVTTWAIVCVDRDRRPGVSTWLYAERASNEIYNGIYLGPGNTIDFVARVTKVGKVFGFTEVEAIDVDSGKVIATGRHVKYLPGSLIQSIMLGPLLPLSKLICDNFMQTYSTSEPLTSMDDLLEMKDLSQDYKFGKLCLGKFHNNPHGTFHGGSQAITMELMGQKCINHTFEGNNLHANSIDISYMSPGSGDVSVVSNIGNVYDNNNMSVNVKIHNSRGKQVSEGIIKYNPLPK